MSQERTIITAGHIEAAITRWAETYKATGAFDDDYDDVEAVSRAIEVLGLDEHAFGEAIVSFAKWGADIPQEFRGLALAFKLLVDPEIQGLARGYMHGFYQGVLAERERQADLETLS